VAFRLIDPDLGFESFAHVLIQEDQFGRSPYYVHATKILSEGIGVVLSYLDCRGFGSGPHRGQSHITKLDPFGQPSDQSTS
jgi:hypothetical protein